MAIGTSAGSKAPPEFLVLLLEADRLATYVLHRKVEGWSIAESPFPVRRFRMRSETSPQRKEEERNEGHGKPDGLDHAASVAE
jgi:hypothetical protein